ncbi:MAG TPA: pyrroline-5-carboxylate reductase [Dehalococcoidia bacterium]|nr:pyrroline-5-carboxylate reductase [Dehalococcoidia bacterium]
MKVAIVGGGVMGEAIVGALLAKGVAEAGDIAVCDVLEERRRILAERYGVRTHAQASEAVRGADVTVLAVKPQEFPAAARSLAGGDAPPLFLSIMAGVPLRSLMSLLGSQRVARAMPNTPAQIGEGVAVWTASPAVDETDREKVRQVLAALGYELYVDDEKYVEMATAVSGSGPGFVFLLLEALVDGAVHIGLPRPMAVELVYRTVLGSVRYAQASGRHPAELRAQVTSPGGTTAAGLLALERAGVRAAIVAAIEAAHRRALELGGQ